MAVAATIASPSRGTTRCATSLAAPCAIPRLGSTMPMFEPRRNPSTTTAAGGLTRYGRTRSSAVTRCSRDSRARRPPLDRTARRQRRARRAAPSAPAGRRAASYRRRTRRLHGRPLRGGAVGPRPAELVDVRLRIAAVEAAKRVLVRVEELAPRPPSPRRERNSLDQHIAGPDGNRHDLVACLDPAARRADAASTTVPFRLTFVERARDFSAFSICRQSGIEV